MITEIPIARDAGSELWFDENDIRQACRMMVCGEHTEECITLMKARNMECALCYAVLTARKKPFRAKRVRLSREQG